MIYVRLSHPPRLADYHRYKKYLRVDFLYRRVRALTPCGVYTKEHIRLNRIELVTWRRERASLLADIAQSKRILARLGQRQLSNHIRNLLNRHLELCESLKRRYVSDLSGAFAAHRNLLSGVDASRLMRVA